MRYLIRERIFSLGNKFDIKDEFGKVMFTVEGKVFTFGDKLNIYDNRGNKLIYIEQKLFKFLPEYHMYKDGKKIAKLKKELTVIRPKFNISSDYGNIKVEGDILHHDFNLRRGRQVLATVSKKWISLSDSYSVNIDSDVDHAFILGVVIVLDQIFYDMNNNSNNGVNS